MQSFRISLLRKADKTDLYEALLCAASRRTHLVNSLPPQGLGER